MVYTAPGTIVEYLKLDQDGNILVGPDTISLPEFTSNIYAHMTMDSLQFLHVVWQAYQFDMSYIMYCKLDTLGNYIISPMKIVHPPYSVYPLEPRIVVDHSDRLHLVWIDQRLGSEDIFYKRGENENTVEEMARLKTASLPKISVFPNPFSKLTKISISKKQSAEGIELKIYDVRGKLIKEFNLKYTVSDIQSVVWDSRDNSGNKLPSGVYFLKFQAGDYSTTEKLILLR